VEVFTFGMDQSQFALLTIPCAVIGLLIFSLGLNMEDSRRRTPKDTIGKVKE